MSVTAAGLYEVAHHAAPTTDNPMHRPMPRVAQEYGETDSRNWPTCRYHMSPEFRTILSVMHTLKASPSPVKSRSMSPLAVDLHAANGITYTTQRLLAQR